MRFIGSVASTVLALSCVVPVASASEPAMAFSADHPKGSPSILLSWSEQYHGIFNIGPGVARVGLTADWLDAKLRTADDEFKFYLGKLRYASYLNNLCGGTPCTVVANIRAYVPRDKKEFSPLIVRLTLNGSSKYMESYMYESTDGTWHVFSRGESGWIKKCNTAEAPDFKGISAAALYLVWKDTFRVH